MDKYSDTFGSMEQKRMDEHLRNASIMLEEYVQQRIKDATAPLLQEITELKYQLKVVTATFNSDIIEPPYKKIRSQI